MENLGEGVGGLSRGLNAAIDKILHIVGQAIKLIQEQSNIELPNGTHPNIRLCNFACGIGHDDRQGVGILNLALRVNLHEGIETG